MFPLEANARLALTNSGGMKEETCILGVPCVTMRDSSERPETLEAKSNILAEANAESILKAARHMMKQSIGWTNPFGDGRRQNG